MEVITRRCDAIVVQLVVTEYDEQNRPVGELTMQPIKVFRATAVDFWATVDQGVRRYEEALKT